jgi:hypothetical protein
VCRLINGRQPCRAIAGGSRRAAQTDESHLGQAEAERLNIAPELMLRKKTLEALLKSGFPNGPYQLPDSLRGWRRELMGQAARQPGHRRRTALKRICSIYRSSKRETKCTFMCSRAMLWSAYLKR